MSNNFTSGMPGPQAVEMLNALWDRVTEQIAGTSTTSLAIGTGTKTLTIEAGKQFAIGQTARITYNSDINKWMQGTVSAYNATTGSLSISVDTISSSGTYAVWTVALTGSVGPTGATGAKFDGGVVSTSTPVVEVVQTWNNAGVTFVGKTTNITDTASASESLIEAWQVGGVTKAGIGKRGQVCVYGTYTDGSNYRRLTQTMSTAGVAEIKPEGAGTGASGNVLHISGLPTSDPGPGILWNDGGTVKVGAWSPIALWPDGINSPGMWISPRTLTSQWQDYAGTTPVAVPGTVADSANPVGLILDKSEGPVLGPELVTASLIPYTANGTASVAAGVTTATCTTNGVYGLITDTNGMVGGFTYALSFEVVTNSASRSLSVYPNLAHAGISVGASPVIKTYNVYAPVTSGVNANLSFVIFDGLVGESFSVRLVSIKVVSGHHASQSTSTARPLLSARKNLLVGTETLATQSVAVAAGAHTIQWTGAGTVTASGAYSGALTTGQTFTTTAGSLTLTVAGSVTLAQLETGSTATTYQRVNTASDYDGDPTKFPYYLSHGLDDFLVTASGGGASTAAMVCIGFTTTLAGAAQTLWTDRTGNTGLSLGISAGNAIVLSGGNGSSIVTVTGDAVSLGTPYVVTALYDGTNLSVQLNNATPVTGACALSAGQAAITVGAATGGASGIFKGSIFEVVYVKDAVTAPADVVEAKEWVAAKTGVTL